MHQEKLQRIQNCMGHNETREFLKLAIGKGEDLLIRLNSSFEKSDYQEVQRQLSQSIGSIHLYGSSALTELCKQALEKPLSGYSKEDISLLKKKLNSEFKKTFSSIEQAM